MMRTSARAAALLCGCIALAAVAAVAAAAQSANLKEGKKLAFDRKKGNCLACHMVVDGVSPGNIGPPLIAMKARFPDRAKLRMQIWDATTVNPESAMPPFGRHRILSEEEVDKVTDYIWSL